MAIGLQLIWSSFLAYSIIQGLLLLAVFPAFKQGSPQAKWLLALLALTSSLVLAEEFIESIIGYENFPHLLFVFSPFWYVFSPLLYFYIRLYVTGRVIRWWDFWHFTPMVIVIFNTLDFYRRSTEVKLDYLQYMASGNLHPIHNVSFILFSTQCLGYLMVSSYLLQRKRGKKPSNKGESRWISLLILILAIICLQSLISLYVFNNRELSGWTSDLYYIALISFLLLLLLRSIRNPKTLYLIGRPPSFSSAKKSTLKDFQRITEYMLSSKSYANPEYDIQNLASKLGYSKHYIKQLIKAHTQSSFRDFINQFRVEEAKKRLKSAESKQFTIEFIALESGFNSQATFYRVFKKMEGRTPKSFITG